MAPPENEPETETETVTAPATNEVDFHITSVVAESYLTKMVLFAVILALFAWYIRRRRSDNNAFETEKSVA